MLNYQRSCSKSKQKRVAIHCIQVLKLLLLRRLSPVEVDSPAHLYHVLIFSAFLVILASCVCLFSSSFQLFLCLQRRRRAGTQNPFLYFFHGEGGEPERACLAPAFVTFRAIRGMCSTLLSDCFCLRSATTRTAARTRSQSIDSLALPKARTRYGLFALSFLASDRWNSLPADIRSCSSLSLFRKSIRDHIGYPVKRP